MKKISLNNIIKIIPAFLALISGIFLFSINQNAYAEQLTTLPEYFSVYVANYNSSSPDNPYAISSNDQFENGDAIFVKDNEAVVLEFVKDKLLMNDNANTPRISQDVSYTIKINGAILSTTPTKDSGFDFITQGQIFKLAINPALSTEFNYGSYSITFSYWYLNDNYDAEALSFTCNFYIFRYNDYCTSLNKQIYTGNENVSINYGNYNQDNLVNLCFDYEHFNVNIVKVHQQLSYTTQIKKSGDTYSVVNTNEQSVQTDKQYVIVNKIDGANKVQVTFNDIGTYYISFEPVNPYGQNEVITNYFDLRESEYPNASQTVYVFGYQAFFTGANGLKEFKQLNSDSQIQNENTNIINQQADITSAFGKSDTSNILLFAQTSEIVKTNQAPIYFSTNAIPISDANVYTSKYYYFKDVDTLKKAVSLPTATSTIADAYVENNYNGSPLSTAGVYLVELNYSYEKLSGLQGSQYFLFEITNSSPEISVEEEIVTIDGDNEIITYQSISTDYITYNNVKIKKAETGIFDAPSVLRVYKATSFKDSDFTLNNSTLVTDGEGITVNESAKYKVELTYGNKGQKNYILYFTIDKTGVGAITISTLTNYSGSLYKKGDTLTTLCTNLPIALSWDSKQDAGKAQVYAEYKFFPTNYSSNFTNTLSSDILKNYYNSPYTTYGIPSTDTFSYTNGNMPVSTYANTASKTILGASDILSAGGLYIFKIYDQTAFTKEVEGENVVYKVVFVDNTKTNIIASSSDVWTIAKDAKVTSNDYTLLFGSNKLIQFENTSTNIASLDNWLQNVIVGEFKNNFITYKDKMYFKIDTLATIYYTKDGSPYSFVLSPLNNYSITESAMMGTVANESQYVFYMAVASNSLVDNSFESYYYNSSTSHMVTFSTDNSKMRLSYTNQLGNVWDLQQFNVAKDSTGTKKVNYYQPTAKDTLKYNNEILNFSYCTEPTAQLSVEYIKMEYYAFEKCDDANIVTYVFNNQPTSSLYIYEKDKSLLGTAVGDELDTYTWELNVENYNITTTTTGTRTRAGKYVITRKYVSAVDAYDPIERQLIFIVDRNGIISAPEVDASGNSIYYTGSGIKLQVLNNYQSITQNTLFFQDIYFASQMSGENSSTSNPVLVTNLMPVTLYVPAYKYGFDVFNTNKFNFNYKQADLPNVNGEYSYSIPTQYYDIASGQYKSYDAYKLSAYVEYRQTNVLTTPYEARYDFTKQLSNNYLTTSSADGIITFNKNGYYHAVITSNGSDIFTFDFQIEYRKPEYSILDEKNNPISANNGVYYTNKSKVRISWQDSYSDFLANINKNEISYKLSNGISGKIDPNSIVSNGDNNYYVDLDLKQINGAYTDGSQIDITLQFNGEKADYNNQDYFSKTSTIIIDLEAPISNVAKLISQTGLSFNTLRAYATGYGNMYNMSKSDGLFANYSFVIDVANLVDILKAPEQTNFDFARAYYRVFENDGVNTKYVIGNTQESEIYLDNYNDTSDNILFNGGQSSTSRYTYEYLKNFVGKYVEIIEQDYAGNRTVFTIYITDITQSAHTAIIYNTLNSSSGSKPNEIAFADLQESMNFYSKYSLSLEKIDFLNNEDYLNGRYFQLVEVNGELFVKTPFSNNKFYKYSDYTSTDSQTYTLEQLTTLLSNASSQPIVIYSVPYLEKININAYVLNKKLEYQTLSKFEGEDLVEGIVIKLPSKTADNNILYATSLVVTGVINGAVITPFVIDDISYFVQEQPVYKSQNYTISYVGGVGSDKYFKFEITKVINKNDYFVYTITDNFGEEVKVPHIYGQIEILNPITSEGEIITSYDQNGNYTYYASENIAYRYDTTIYSEPTTVSVSFAGQSYSFRISKDRTKIKIEKWNATTSGWEEDTELYQKFLNCSLQSGAIMKLELKQSIIDVAKGELGNSYTFIVTLTMNKDFSTDEGASTDTKYFCIYNKVPKISLLGESGDDVTKILGNKSVYTKSIRVNYEQTKLDYVYEVYIITPDNIVMLLKEEYTAKDNGTYRIVINYLGDLKGLSKTLYFTIKNTSEYKFSVMKINADGSYSEVQATNNVYQYKITNGNTTITKTEQNHYIVNGDYIISLNESLNLICETTVSHADDYTTIYTIHTDYSIDTITEFFSCRIAVSRIPQTYTLLKENEFVEYDSSGNSQDLTKSTSIISSILTQDGYDAGRKIAWKDWYLIPENKINATIYYGEVGKTALTPIISTSDDLKTITLRTSGVYYFKFSDIAGNSHLFGTYLDTEYFAIKYLSSVIFEINDESPINYAIYDQSVKISIPESTLNYYDANAKPTINVELNGQPIEVKKDESGKYVWTMTTAGLYKITFSAKIGGENIYEAPLYFTILSSKETRTVFNFSAYADAYIEDILLNGVSVNNKLANANTGDLYNNKYLRNITLHKNDLKTGEGVWTFVINANNEFNQKYTFSVWINNPSVPITLSHQSGTSTTDKITITFLTSNILSEAGDCILKITGKDDLYITAQALQDGKISELNEISLDRSGEYFIEVTTLSGQLLYSAYVNKVEPLNAVSIILIVVASIVLVGGTVVFFLLRKRMKVK